VSLFRVVVVVRIPIEVIAGFAAGLAIMALLGYLLLIPKRFLWRMAAGGVLGTISILVMNFFSGLTGIYIALNPFNALIIGFLGLPGALLLVVLNVFIL